MSFDPNEKLERVYRFLDFVDNYTAKLTPLSASLLTLFFTMLVTNGRLFLQIIGGVSYVVLLLALLLKGKS